VEEIEMTENILCAIVILGVLAGIILAGIEFIAGLKELGQECRKENKP